MTILFKDRANPDIANLVPYQPGKPIDELARETGLTDIIKLASNENPLGASAATRAAALQAMQDVYLYPDGGCYALKCALSQFYHLPNEYFTIGNGSENILEVIVKAFLMPRDQAVLMQYSFATIPLVLKSIGAQIITVPTRDWQFDADAFLAAINEKTKIVFIVNPNNPTGTYVPKKELEKILQSIPPQTLIVLDEAYNEYIDQPDYSDALPYLNKYPNLIITRTFSKAYGLAGLRIGYAISQPEVADLLNRARLPFNVNLVGAAAAIAALNDQAHVKKSKSLNDAGMKQLEMGLKKLNFSFIPSAGNFISVNFGNKAMEVYHALLAQGIIVRPLASYGMTEFLRITIGTSAQIERLLNALASIKEQL